MQKLLQESGFKKKISVWAFDDIGETLLHTQNSLIKEPLSFIYVASLLPYKNHHRLLKAWKKLKDEGIEPRLYLTIDQDNSTKKIIEEFVLHNKLNVVFLKKLCREELIKFYEKAEFLIYPSYFEAYGLPLIEAKKFQLKILAADIDYSWDFLIPDDFFNPHDVDSIVRALKRSLKVTPKLDTIYSPKEFINKLMIE
jgi:glycosyltransferase involved in cell wall biosynthesis